MKFGIFFEISIPRPWDDGVEKRVYDHCLEQTIVADECGFDTVWAVEHHFLEEYSHSSAPEVFLAAASQRTERIRLGHGIVQLPPAFNHPARIAERAATLDLISGADECEYSSRKWCSTAQTVSKPHSSATIVCSRQWS